VIGRKFNVDVLRKVVGYPKAQLQAALDDAAVAGIIEEYAVLGTTITYRFSYAFFRKTLYEEILALRRIRLHQVASVGRRPPTAAGFPMTRERVAAS
jgi:predicted ATPase